jgi:acyl-CoA synthetase (AMP-forming)/AMP-acid ligase II
VSGGENVDPLEVEQALERLPGVTAACVFGVPDEAWGEVVCVAMVSTDPDPAALPWGKLIGDALAPHKRPRRIAFVPTLALSANGKLDRRGTRALAETRLVRIV